MFKICKDTSKIIKAKTLLTVYLSRRMSLFYQIIEDDYST